MDPSKVTTIQEWSLPVAITHLRAFLGLTGYYRRFIKNYASIVGPLTDLLQKDNFHWSPAAESAFIALKHALLTAPVLVLPDFTKPFIVETDASGQGIGAVLLQDVHPIAYFSKKLSTRMHNQSAYVRELYAITEAVAKFRHYLVGHSFVIRTDQRNLKHLTDQVIQTPEQEALLPKLLGFNFSFEYKPGPTNQAADALSRSFHMAISFSQSSMLADIKREVSSSTSMQQLILQFKSDPAAMPHHTLRDGMLFLRQRLLILMEARNLITGISLLIYWWSCWLSSHTCSHCYLFLLVGYASRYS